MWPFKQKSTEVSTQEFADALWLLLRKLSTQCYREMKVLIPETQISAMAPEEDLLLAREIIVAYLWAMSNSLGGDNKPLDAVHSRYLTGHYNLGKTREEKGDLANAAQAELHERYSEYYKAWDADTKCAKERGETGTATAFEMLQRFFPKHKPVVDFRLLLLVQAHILNFMVAAREFTTKFTVTESQQLAPRQRAASDRSCQQ